MSKPTPTPNGPDGRDAGGRFAKGNAGGPGNPHARRVARLRALVVEAVTDVDMRDVLATLIRCAIDGEPWAVRELLDRTIGKAQPFVDDDADAAANGKLEIIVRHVDKPRYGDAV